MDRMLAEIAALDTEIRKLREGLAETASTRDLHERLTAGAAEKAEQVATETRKRLRMVITTVFIGLVIWTPFLAWAAIAWHQVYLRDCVTDVGYVRVQEQPWHCDLFPDTTRHH